MLSSKKLMKIKMKTRPYAYTVTKKESLVFCDHFLICFHTLLCNITMLNY